MKFKYSVEWCWHKTLRCWNTDDTGSRLANYHQQIQLCVDAQQSSCCFVHESSINIHNSCQFIITCICMNYDALKIQMITLLGILWLCFIICSIGYRGNILSVIYPNMYDKIAHARRTNLWCKTCNFVESLRVLMYASRPTSLSNQTRSMWQQFGKIILYK